MSSANSSPPSGLLSAPSFYNGASNNNNNTNIQLLPPRAATNNNNNNQNNTPTMNPRNPQTTSLRPASASRARSNSVASTTTGGAHSKIVMEESDIEQLLARNRQLEYESEKLNGSLLQVCQDNARMGRLVSVQRKRIEELEAAPLGNTILKYIFDKEQAAGWFTTKVVKDAVAGREAMETLCEKIKDEYLQYKTDHAASNTEVEILTESLRRAHEVIEQHAKLFSQAQKQRKEIILNYSDFQHEEDFLASHNDTLHNNDDEVASPNNNNNSNVNVTPSRGGSNTLELIAAREKIAQLENELAILGSVKKNSDDNKKKQDDETGQISVRRDQQQQSGKIHEELDLARGEAQMLAEQLQAKTVERELMAQEIEKIRAQNNEFRERDTLFRERDTKIREQNGELRKFVEELSTTNSTLKAQLKAAETKFDEEVSKNHKQVAAGAAAKKKGLIEIDEAYFANLKVEHATFKAKNEELETSIKRLKDDAAMFNEKTKKQLKQLESDVQQTAQLYVLEKEKSADLELRVSNLQKDLSEARRNNNNNNNNPQNNNINNNNSQDDNNTTTTTTTSTNSGITEEDMKAAIKSAVDAEKKSHQQKIAAVSIATEAMKEMLDETTQYNETLKQHLQEREEEMERLTKEHQQREQAFAVADVAIVSAKDQEIENLRKQIAEQKSVVENQQKELEAEKHNNSEKDKQMEAQKQQLAQIQETANAENQDKSAARKRSVEESAAEFQSQLLKQSTQHDEEKAKLVKAAATEKSRADQAEDASKDLEQNLFILNQEFAKTKTENGEISQLLHNANNQVVELQKEIEGYQQREHDCNEQHAPLISQQKHQIEQLNENLRIAGTNQEESKSALLSLKQQSEQNEKNHQHQLDEVKKEKEDLKSKMARAEKEHQEQLDKLKQQGEASENDKAGLLQQEVNTLDEKLKAEKKAHSDEVDKLKNEKMENDKKRQIDAENEKKKHEQEIVSLKQQSEKSLSEQKSATDKKMLDAEEVHKKEVSQLKSDTEKLRLQISDSSKQHKQELDALTAKAAGLEKKLNESASTEIDEKTNKKKADEKNQQLEDQIAILKQENSEKEDQLNGLSEVAAKAEMERDRAKQEEETLTHQLATTKQQIQNAQQRILELETKNIDLTQQCKKSQEKVQTLQKENENLVAMHNDHEQVAVTVAPTVKDALKKDETTKSINSNNAKPSSTKNNIQKPPSFEDDAALDAEVMAKTARNANNNNNSRSATPSRTTPAAPILHQDPNNNNNNNETESSGDIDSCRRQLIMQHQLLSKQRTVIRDLKKKLTDAEGKIAENEAGGNDTTKALQGENNNLRNLAAKLEKRVQVAEARVEDGHRQIAELEKQIEKEKQTTSRAFKEAEIQRKEKEKLFTENNNNNNNNNKNNNQQPRSTSPVPLTTSTPQSNDSTKQLQEENKQLTSQLASLQQKHTTLTRSFKQLQEQLEGWRALNERIANPPTPSGPSSSTPVAGKIAKKQQNDDSALSESVIDFHLDPESQAPITLEQYREIVSQLNKVNRENETLQHKIREIDANAEKNTSPSRRNAGATDDIQEYRQQMDKKVKALEQELDVQRKLVLAGEGKKSSSASVVVKKKKVSNAASLSRQASTAPGSQPTTPGSENLDTEQATDALENKLLQKCVLSSLEKLSSIAELLVATLADPQFPSPRNGSTHNPDVEPPLGDQLLDTIYIVESLAQQNVNRSRELGLQLEESREMKQNQQNKINDLEKQVVSNDNNNITQQNNIAKSNNNNIDKAVHDELQLQFDTLSEKSKADDLAKKELLKKLSTSESELRYQLDENDRIWTENKQLAQDLEVARKKAGLSSNMTTATNADSGFFSPSAEDAATPRGASHTNNSQKKSSNRNKKPSADAGAFSGRNGDDDDDDEDDLNNFDGLGILSPEVTKELVALRKHNKDLEDEIRKRDDDALETLKAMKAQASRADDTVKKAQTRVDTLQKEFDDVIKKDIIPLKQKLAECESFLAKIGVPIRSQSPYLPGSLPTDRSQILRLDSVVTNDNNNNNESIKSNNNKNAVGNKPRR